MSPIFGIYLFFLSLFLALIEIEIEGKDGWAIKTATFRKDLSNIPIIGRIAWSREITGYHTFLNIFLFLTFHLPYFFGHPLNLANELELLAYFLLFGVTWDFLWFVMNPHFGFAKFKKTEIPWFSQNKWIFKDRVSIPHVMHLFVGTLLASLSAVSNNNPQEIAGYLVNLVVFALLSVITILLSPFYHQLYEALRK
jgi:hypothetical protein